MAIKFLNSGIFTGSVTATSGNFSGKVLIGNPTGYYAGTDLVIGNITDAQNGLNILTSTTGYGYILFGDGSGASTYKGQISYNHNDDSLSFNANNTEALSLNSDQSATFASSVTAGGTILSNTQLKAITSTGGTSGYFTDAVNSTLQIKHASSQLQFLNGSNIAWLKEDGSGAVTFASSVSAGAGTFSGDVNVNNSKLQITATTPQIILSVPSGGLDSRIYNDGAGNFIIGHGTNSATPPTVLTIATNLSATFASSVSATNGFFSGEVWVPDYIYHTGDSNTFFGFSGADNYKIQAGGNDNFAVNVNQVYLKHQGNTKLITTSTGIDVTGNVSATDGLFSNKVGVRTTTPLTDIDVNGDNGAAIRISLPSSSTVIGDVLSSFETYSSDSSGGVSPSVRTSIRTVAEDIYGRYMGLSFSTAGIGGENIEALRLSNNQSATFASSVSATDGLFSGNVGVGTIDPKQLFQVSGGTTSGNISKAIIGGTGGNAESHLYLAENFSGNEVNYGFSFMGDGNSSNNLLIKRHNNSVVGSTVITIKRDSDDVTFSSSVTAGGNLNFTPTSGFSIIGVNGTDLNFYNGTGAETRLTIAQNGAATFSSSVSATDGLFSGNVGIGTTASSIVKLSIVKDNTSGNAVQIDNSGSSRSLEINHNVDNSGLADDIVRINSNGIRKFTLADSGSATFASSVSATSFKVGSQELFEANGNFRTNYGIETLGTLRSYANLIVGGTSTFVGSATFASSVSAGGNVTINTSSNVVPYLFLTRNSGSNGVGVIQVQDGGHLSFDTGATGAAQSEKVRILANGNVGIGTTSPSYKLEVAGQGFFTSGIITNTAVAVKLKQAAGTLNDATEFRVGGGEFKMYSGRDSGLHQAFVFATGDNYTSGSERMRIAPSGNVGIGTTLPGKTLQVGDGTADDVIRTVFSDGSYTDIHGYGLYMSRTDSYIRPVTDETQTLRIGDDSNTWNNIIYNANLHTFNNDVSEWMRITSTGNVGIGTTSPSQKLEVSGNIKLSTLADKIMFGSGGTSPAWSGAQIARIGSAMTMSDYSGVQFGGYDGTSYGPRMTVLGTGNVGIGTDSPLSKLHINDGTNVNLKVGNVGGELQIKTTNDADTAYSPMVLRASEYNILSGNVGIGTTSPGTINGVGFASVGLHINNGTLGRTITEGSSWAEYILNDSGTSADLRAKYIKSDNGVLSLGSYDDNGTARNHINILNNGNVGIGTTTPAVILQVVKASESEIRATESTTGNHLALYQQAGTSYLIAGKTTGTATQNLQIYTGSSARMTITSTGNVGIGTTSPGAKLHVVAPVGTNIGGYNFNFILDAQDNNEVDSNGLLVKGGALSANAKIFEAQDYNGVSKFAIKGTGNVGIGTDSPNSKLHVMGTGQFILGSSGIQLYGTGGSGNINSLGANDLILMVNSDEKMRIRDSGNVGIGTTNPDYNLEVNGKIATNAGGIVIEGQEIYGNSEYSGDDGSVRINRFGYLGGITKFRDTVIYNGKGNQIMTIDGSSGNVGIGTTLPQSKLEVVSTIPSSIPALGLDSNLFQIGGGTYGTMFGSISNGNGYIQQQRFDGTATAYNLLLQPNGGNVGIGTTTPGVKLDVAGDVFINSNYNGSNVAANDLTIGKTTTGNHGITIATGPTYTGSIYFGDSDNNDAGIIGYQHSDNSMKFTTNRSEKMRIDTNGNVMIGNTSASAKLDIRQDTGYALRTENASGYTFRVEADTGNIEAAGSIQMADDTDTASASKVGTMRYRTGTEYVEVTGVELVTNGDFATDTNWTKGANTTISGGTLNSTAIGVYIIAFQNGVVAQNLYYKWTVTYTITSGGIRLGDSNNVWVGSQQTTSGTYTGFVQASSTANGILYMTSPSSDFIGSVDNVSVTEATAEDASYADMCMQTGASTYEWVNIVRNTY